MGKEKNKMWIGIVIIMALGFMALFLGGAFISFGNAADGTATDTIARMSYGGVLWKTWRLELTNDHPIGDSAIIAQRYGIENDQALIAQLQQYQDSGKKVKLYYHSHWIIFNWEYSDPEVIYRAEQIG